MLIRIAHRDLEMSSGEGLIKDKLLPCLEAETDDPTENKNI
jgi:hypothetical protein